MAAAIKKHKVLVGMSGGVDSSVAAYLLVEQGYEVVGMTMCLGIEDTSEAKGVQCCGTEAINDARKVCDTLGIDHYVLNFSNELKKTVIDDFLDEYSKGRTPNPCVRCNEFLKFGKLLRQALGMGYDFLATGHYARIENTGDEFFLKKANDSRKDQTYFLYPIKKQFLGNVLFPLEGISKNRVRQIASEMGLHVADKLQSQDICFIPDKDYKKFLKAHGVTGAGGDIVDRKGQILGTHSGLVNYTVGQRKGLGISHEYPLYVLKLDINENRLVVGPKDCLKCESFLLANFNQLVDQIPDQLTCRTRFQGSETPCTLTQMEDGWKVVFSEVHDAVSPGQSAVFYCDEFVIGGGIIECSI